MSRLRIQETFEPFPAQHYISHSSAIPSPSRPQKRQKMTLSQTYALASLARTKLGKEAARPDHNLRLLVGTANLLDFLMLDLREAEREQEAWFNHSVARAQKAEEQHSTGHVRWADTIVEAQDDVDDSDSSDDEYNEEDFEIATMHVRQLKTSPVTVSSREIDEDEDMYDDEDEDAPELALHRTASHPPDLIHDSDSDDDSPPASPPQPTLLFSEEQSFDLGLFKQTTPVKDSFFRDGYYIPERESPLIESY